MNRAESLPRRDVWKPLVLVALVAMLGGLYWWNRSWLQLSWLAEREAELQGWFRESPALVLVSVLVVYVLVTALSLPGATGMSLLIGWFFGFWTGLVLVSFASTLGATGAFLLSRFFFRGWLESRYGERLRSFDTHLEHEGPFYLLTLRLIPVVPFFVINAVMGLTRIRTWTFAWISQLGMLPGTAVYVYAGASVPDLQTLADEGVAAVVSPARLAQLTFALVLLGVFPLVIRWGLRLRGAVVPGERGELSEAEVERGAEE